jgi:hypothetical protein
MFSVMQTVKRVLWLTEVKFSTHTRSKPNRVHPKETTPMDTSVMIWKKRLKETGKALLCVMSCENSSPVR